jgi:septal ring factor EnvC (AmiA/AmiB activator)
MTRRTIAVRFVAWFDPGLRHLQRDTEAAWRICGAQIRQIGSLHAARKKDREQIKFLDAELRRVIEERFTLNTTLTETVAQLAAARTAHDQEERRAARYRLAWTACQRSRSRIKEQTDPDHSSVAPTVSIPFPKDR